VTTLEKALIFLAGLILMPLVGVALAAVILFLGAILFSISPFGTGPESGRIGLGLMALATLLGLGVAAGVVAALWRWIRRSPWLRWFTYGALIGFALGWLALWGSCGLLLATAFSEGTS
jgi:hypothetical protein